MTLAQEYALVFLGGTVGENPWRVGFIERLVARGVPRRVIFDPVVKDWNDAARVAEERAKSDPRTLLLFYLGDPQDGERLSAYSLVEATLAICNDANRTALVVDPEGVDDHGRKVLAQTETLLRAQAPSVPIFQSLADAEGWLVGQFARAK